MKITGRQILAAGAGAVLAIGADRAVDFMTDGRQAYPDGVICSTALEPGDSPRELAEDSLFKADEEDIIRRSQFLNPQAVLLHDAGDKGHYFVGDSFNIMLKEGVRHRRTACVIAGLGMSKLNFTFPDIKTAANILKNTAVVVEKSSRPYTEANFAFRRCGAIAVGSTLLMPSHAFVSGDLGCRELRAGEIDDQKFKIVSDQDKGPWRFVKVEGAEFEGVEMADDYVPKAGDILLYSGYSRGGHREYFRVIVAGNNKGRLLIRARLDQDYPDEYIANYRNHVNGTGGFFTLDGRLVALAESTDEIDQRANEYRRIYSDQYQQSLIAHNKDLAAAAKEYGYNVDTYIGEDETPEQYVFALRVFSEDIDKASAITSKPRTQTPQ